ncbi:LacI family DNA-binding transcriptional regulator [Chitinophagaceae bacterium MMS25-I14]
MKFESITIKDIAKALGLSTSTVSRALRDSYEISAETKQQVMEYARKMNYKPNPVALSLKERRSKSIGVVVSEIANSFFSEAINGIESIANECGYQVIITQTHDSYEREISSLQHLASRSVDGLLVSLSSETIDIEHLKSLHDKGMPIVFFDRVADEIKTHKVISDNFQGAYDAVHHLASNGFTKIAFLGNAEHLSIIKERFAGYCKALEDNNIPFNPALVKYCLHGGLIYAEAEEALQELMKAKPDAVLACSDKLTTSCLYYFRANNIKVPDDIALAGFSNLQLTELLQPPLTIIRQQAFEIGENATTLLLQLLEARRPVKQFETKKLPAQLFIRESSAGKRKKQPQKK